MEGFTAHKEAWESGWCRGGAPLTNLRNRCTNPASNTQAAGTVLLRGYARRTNFAALAASVGMPWATQSPWPKVG
jgi:hypothetical protein